MHFNLFKLHSHHETLALLYTLVMKKTNRTELTAAPALALNADTRTVALNVRMGTAYEVNGGWYGALARFIEIETGHKVTVLAHGPKLGEIYGVGSDLNTLGLQIKPASPLSAAARKLVLKTAAFYLTNVTVQRTTKANAKTRMGLREASTIHKTVKVENMTLAVYGITRFIVAL